MKVLFLMFHGFSDHSGISKKVKGQVSGLAENGAKVDLAYYAIDAAGARYWVVADVPVVSLGKGWKGKLRKRFFWGALKDYILAQQYDLVYIRSFHNANPFTAGFVKGIRAEGTKVVIEIPTYPYDMEYQSLFTKPKLFVDRLFRQHLMTNVDAVVTFSEDKVIFGQRTIQISNGIDFAAIPLRTVRTRTEEAIHLIAVAEIHYWHGFDRMVKGLGEYYRSKPEIPVFLHIVGEYSGARERAEIEGAIAKYAVADYVTLHGALFGDPLDRLFDSCDFAIGSLGRHRTGIVRMRSLKNREYAARGIPFAYAESDLDFDDQPYVLKYPADESAIAINPIIHYLQKQALSPAAIRDTVLGLSWESQMAIVLAQV